MSRSFTFQLIKKLTFQQPSYCTNQLAYSTMPSNLSNSVDVREAKNILRLKIKSKLKELSEANKIKQTYIVTRRLLKNPDFQKAERIAIYVNMKNEVGTYDILKGAFKGNKQVFIPLVIGDDMKMVKLNSFEDLKSMPKTKWGIIQPLESDNREDSLQNGGVQCIVVPGVAFTTNGLRLGHGRGYYDRYLRKNNEITGSKCKTIGLGFNEQIVEDLPTNENDFRLTGVIYPNLSPPESDCDVVPSQLTPPPDPFSI